MTNKFASALKNQATAGGGGNQAAGKEETVGRGKHIGGYFDPAVYKQLRTLMVDEDTTIQALLEEALDLLFQTRNRPMIARKNT